MASTRKPSRASVLALGSAILLVGGVLVGAIAPAWLGLEPDAHHTPDVARLPPRTQSSEPGRVQMQMKRLAAPKFTPDFSNLSQDPRFARYDNIVVEVKSDGTLRVLGEPMEMDKLRDLLGDQVHDQLKTFVTIRPDENCKFRHVGRVISVCDEVGVPHRMVPTTAVQAAVVNSSGPA